MPVKIIDLRGLKFPLPALKIQKESLVMGAGEILEVVADCPTFEADVRRLCDAMKKALLFVKAEGTSKRVQIRI